MLKMRAEIMQNARANGWVLEPDTLRILAAAGVAVVPHRLVRSVAEAVAFAGEHGYPLVAKVVSPAIMHKSEYGGVVVGVADEQALAACLDKFGAMPGYVGMLVATMVSGLELIVGAKNDPQFGPVILLGLGGTRAEIYQDVTIRMAPLGGADLPAMVERLQGRRLLFGYRGQPAIAMDALVRLLVSFSALAMELEPFASIDLNPVICAADGCWVADGRIVLPSP